MMYQGNLSSLTSGYSQAALAHLRSLVEVGFDDIVIRPEGGAIPWGHFPRWLDPLRRANGSTRTPPLIHSTVDQLATFPPLGENPEPRIAMTALDTDSIPGWAAVGINNAFTRMIVPSLHSKAAAEKAGVTIPVVAIPHPVGEPLWTLPEVDKDPDLYLFYSIGSWNARKNPEAVVRAYCRAFPEPDKEKVRLSLKLTAPEAVLMEIEEICKEEARNAGQTPAPDWARSDVIAQAAYLSDKGVLEYHAYGDCYVTACRGEAWGIAAFQAAVCGRPLIAPDWGAYPEYLSEERGDILVPYETVPVSGMSGLLHYTGGQQWADPDIDAMAEAMRTMYADKRRDVDASKLREDHSWEKLGHALKDALHP
jgi:glycosyltransferase involved in cell wall biosynthesis